MLKESYDTELGAAPRASCISASAHWLETTRLRGTGSPLGSCGSIHRLGGSLTSAWRTAVPLLV